MSFQIIKAETRVSRMVTWFAGIQKKITDFVVGGKTRTKFDAIAVEMEAQDYAFYSAVKKAIPTAIYGAFGFSLLPASRAIGLVRLSTSRVSDANIIIPIGTKVATTGTVSVAEKVYETTEQVFIPAGELAVYAPVECLYPGQSGNTGIDTVNVLKSPVSGIDTVTNPAAITNGADKELEEDRRGRFLQYITTLARGTDDAVVYGALTAALLDSTGQITERVKAAVVENPEDDEVAGQATLYVFNGATGASQELIDKAQKIVDGYYDGETRVPGYKAAGVIVTVVSATVVPIDITITMTVKEGTDLDAIEASTAVIVDSYIQSLTMGQTLIYHEIVERIMGQIGVIDIAMVSPIANITTEPGHVIVANDINVTAVEE